MKTHIEHIYNLGLIGLGMQKKYADFISAKPENKTSERGTEALKVLESFLEAYNGLLTIDTENQQLQMHVRKLQQKLIEQGNALTELKEKLRINQEVINALE